MERFIDSVHETRNWRCDRLLVGQSGKEELCADFKSLRVRVVNVAYELRWKLLLLFFGLYAPYFQHTSPIERGVRLKPGFFLVCSLESLRSSSLFCYEAARNLPGDVQFVGL